ncbi:hypothetical protein STEG23_011594, partial [Scotinomys teguina]
MLTFDTSEKDVCYTLDLNACTWKRYGVLRLLAEVEGERKRQWIPMRLKTSSSPEVLQAYSTRLYLQRHQPCGLSWSKWILGLSS